MPREDPFSVWRSAPSQNGSHNRPRTRARGVGFHPVARHSDTVSPLYDLRGRLASAWDESSDVEPVLRETGGTALAPKIPSR